MECNDWLPEEVTQDEEFLHEDLDVLRDYVLEKREEDISAELYIFENRVMFSVNITALSEEFGQIMSEGHFQPPISWEAIRTLPDGPGKYVNGEKEEPAYTIGKRQVKRCFLRAWLEVGMWDRGGHEEQLVYLPPENPESLGIASVEKDRFCKGEYTRLSFDLMKGYWEKYLRLKPGKRPQKPRLNNPAQSLTKDDSRHVFVSSALWQYYFGEDEKIKKAVSADFPPLEKMMTIRFSKTSDAGLVFLANFISWQEYLHANQWKNTVHPPFEPDSYRQKKPSGRRKDMKDEKSILQQMENLKSEAAKDRKPVPGDIQAILQKIAGESGSSGLDGDEREVMEKACKESPKIRLFFRMAQMEYIRRKTASCLAESGAGELSANSDEKRENSVLSAFRDRIMEAVTEFWTPFGAGELVNAADIPQQKYDFITDHGRIEISCSWSGEYGGQPAYILISWKAYVSESCEFVARFVNPENNEIRCEISLGEYRSGEETLTQDELGFDPANEKWAVSVLLLRIE